jgi:cell wall-associated NlpC family hydrolase
LALAAVTGLAAGASGGVASAKTKAHRRSASSSGGAAMSGTLPSLASAPVPVNGPTTGPTVPGTTAKIVNGVAYAPAGAPLAVQRAIWAGNAIRLKPYVYGGGHGKWNDVGYDCSGSVSYALHAAGLIKTSMDSSDFMQWGAAGVGQWITVYTNPGHAFVQIAGIRLDTSAEQDPHPAAGSGPRWRPLMRTTSGFMARHLSGF